MHMAENKGMDQEEVDVRAEGEVEMPPEERAQTFATAVTDMVAKVASGETTLEEFVESAQAELDTVILPGADLAGLGEEKGSFFDIDSEDREEEVV